MSEGEGKSGSTWGRLVLVLLAVYGAIAIVLQVFGAFDRLADQRRAEGMMAVVVGRQMEILWSRTQGQKGMDAGMRAGAWAEAAYYNYGAAAAPPDRLGFRFNEMDNRFLKGVRPKEHAIGIIPVVEPGEWEKNPPPAEKHVPAAFLDLDGPPVIPVVVDNGKASAVPVKDFPTFLKEHGVNPELYAAPRLLLDGQWTEILG